MAKTISIWQLAIIVEDYVATESELEILKYIATDKESRDLAAILQDLFLCNDAETDIHGSVDYIRTASQLDVGHS